MASKMDKVKSAACAAAMLLAVGCSDVKPFLNTQGVIDDLVDPKILSARGNLPPERQKTFRVAIAPVQFQELVGTATGKDGDGKSTQEAPGQTAGAWGKGAAAPGTTQKAGVQLVHGGKIRVGPADAAASSHQVAYRFRRASDASWVALCYRTPLFRELLFSPTEQPPVPDAPTDATPGSSQTAERALPGDEVEWLCPRCQTTVAEKDGACVDCGLAFAPETAPAPKPGTMPKPLTPDATPTTPQPGEVVAEKQPEAAADRYICFQCGTEVTEASTECPNQTCMMKFDTGLPAGQAIADGSGAADDGKTKGASRGIGARAVGTVVASSDGRHVTVMPSALDLQKTIIDTVSTYNIFRDVKPLPGNRDDLTRPDDLIEVAWNGDTDGEFDYVIVPKLKRWELSYLENTGLKYAASVAMWVMIGEPINLVGFPTAFVAGERYQAQLEFDMKLYHVRSGAEIQSPWQSTLTSTRTWDCDQWDRGYYPWSIVAVPTNAIGPTNNGWKELDARVMGHAVNDVQEALIEKALYPTFVEGTPKDFEAVLKYRETVALLIGLTEMKDNEVRQLQKTSNDIVAMQESLKKVGLKDGRLTSSGSRFVTFEGPQATKNTITKWLAQELTRLNPSDTVLIYYTGYGAAQFNGDAFGTEQNEKFLVCFDTDKNNLKDTALNVAELGKWLRIARVKNAIVALDCSFAVPEIDPRLGTGRTFPATLGRIRPAGMNMADEQKIQQLRQEEQFPFYSTIVQQITGRSGGKQGLLLMASGPDQAAMEYDGIGRGQLGQGLFTHYLAQAIGGAGNAEFDKNTDDSIEVKEIVDATISKVRWSGNVVYGVPQEVRAYGALNMIAFFKNHDAKPAGSAAGK